MNQLANLAQIHFEAIKNSDASAEAEETLKLVKGES